jgi:hypothetical protein
VKGSGERSEGVERGAEEGVCGIMELIEDAHGSSPQS